MPGKNFFSRLQLKSAAIMTVRSSGSLQSKALQTKKPPAGGFFCARWLALLAAVGCWLVRMLRIRVDATTC
jgi:hypothetical protein